MARRTGTPHHHATGRPAHPQRPQGFRRLPGVSHHKEPVAGGGMVHVFRHEELGLLRRLVLHTVAHDNTHVSMELAGAPADPMTAKRAAIFKPLAAELTRRLAARGGSMGAPLARRRLPRHLHCPMSSWKASSCNVNGVAQGWPC